MNREQVKPAVIGVVIIAALLGLLWAARFAWLNLRGIAPALGPPPADIAKLITRQPTGTTSMMLDGNPLTLPQGFSISIFAKGLGSARVLRRDPAGTILVSIPSAGRVVALPDRNHDGIADEVITVVSGLNRPHGFAFRCQEPASKGPCQLFIAESNQVAAYDYDTATMAARNKKKITDLPKGGNHVTRTILLMPPPDDDTLLVSVGSTCNVCHETDWRRAKILSVKIDGSDLKEYARGLRNAVFMAINPATQNIWVTEMGRDLLGDDIPPDEINILKERGNYGWPICYGNNVHDTDFDKNVYIRNPCEEPFETPAFINIPAHSAPLGLAFVPEEGWPEEYRHNMLVAYHGSWNRSVPTGYKIVRVKLDANENFKGVEDFITGWLTKDNLAFGRPVDILALPGGTMFVSDDKAGVIYLIVSTQ